MTLTFYMKSGNKIELKDIKEYEIQNIGNEITGLKITRQLRWFRAVENLLVKTIDLTQIEAITKRG